MPSCGRGQNLDRDKAAVEPYDGACTPGYRSRDIGSRETMSILQIRQVSMF